MNGSSPQAAEELIQKAAEMPKKLLAKHNIQMAKAIKAQPKYKNAKTVGYYESGMALNVTNGIQMVDYLVTYGEAYNPGYPNIALTRLQALTQEAQEMLNISNVKRQDKTVEVNIRKIYRKEIQPLVTRIINELECCGASKLTIKDARYYVNKTRGKRIKNIDPNLLLNHISPRQTSFTELIQHFTNLINVLKSCPEYDPTVEALTIVQLEAFRDNMISSNTAVSGTQAVWSTSRIDRNQFFNESVTGYVDTFLAAKRAVRAIFGADSPQYYQISKLAFKRIRD